MTELAKNITLPTTTTAIAEMGERALSQANDPASIRRLADKLDRAKKIVAEVTGRRAEINKIGKVWLKAIRKGGALLRETAAAGERQARGQMSRGVTLPTLHEMGFSRQRASRWQLAASLPQERWDALEEKIEADPDGILTLAEFLAAAKHLLNEQYKVASVVPTTATIVRAACLDWLPAQPACDLLLTDPPYSTDIEDIEAFTAAWLPVALAKVKRTGRAYVCIGAYEKEIHAYLDIATPADLMRPEVLVWTYRNTLGPSPTRGYKLNWQAVLYYCGIDAPPLDCPLMTEQFSVQDINAPDGRQGDRWHAWQKPDELCERFVRHGSNPGDLILDPFSGSGSFILAAAKLGRVAHGCDIDPQMVALAKRRGCRHAR